MSFRQITSNDRDDDIASKVAALLSPRQKLIEDKFPKTTKNSCGYNLKETLKHGSADLTKLLCGSEGTLGIIVEAKLRLVPAPIERRNLIAYFPTYETCAMAAMESLQFGPAAVEMLDKTFSNTALGIDPGIDEILKKDFASIIIFEFEESEEGLADEKIVKLSEYFKAHDLSRGLVMPRDQNEAAKLWRVRKEASAIFYKIEKTREEDFFRGRRRSSCGQTTGVSGRRSKGIQGA